MKSAIILILTICSLLLPAVSYGRTNYKNQILGGRAATMAGAYSAVADDVSSILYNPAGLSYVQGTSLSGSANLFSINKATYKSTVGSKDWERESQNLDPSYFGIAKKFDDGWSFGVSYGLVDTTKENQNQVFESVDAGSGTMSYYSLILNTEDNKGLIGLAAAYRVSEALSFGFTLNHSYRHYLRTQDQYVQYADGDTEHAFDFKEIKTKGVKPLLGVMWSPAEKWSFGFTLSKEVVLAQVTEEVRNKIDKGSSVPSFVRQTTLSKESTPIEGALGLAYFASPEWLFSANLDGFYETTGSRKSVVNLSMGSEYFVSPKTALRAGLFTNRSNVLDYNSRVRNTDEKIDIYGVSTGVGFYSHNNELTVGVIYAQGAGQVQPFSGSTAVREFTYFNLKFLLASSYNF